jgi:dihydroxyacetone kinase-like protein
VDADTVRRWMRESSTSLHAERDALTKLDSPIGDADHGSNMDRGFTAVVEKLDGLEDTPPGKLLTTAGSTLVSKVGGASGPLWGTALRRAGRSLGEAEEFDGEALVEALAAAQAGAQATTPLLARKGRASYLGERSVGHQDPGATSTALIVAALSRAVAEG